MAKDSGAVLTREECAALFDVVTEAARAAGIRDIEMVAGGHNSSLTRFANNAIHQNVSELSRWVSVRPVMGGRTARATTNRLDPASIRQAIEEAAALTRAVAPEPDMPELAEPGEVEECPRFDEATAASTPEQRARDVAEAIGIVEQNGQTAAGIYSTDLTVESIFNSRGVAAYYSGTLAAFSITAMDRDSSGWAKGSAVRLRDLDPPALAKSASEKARLSRSPREMPAGQYTVVLEPPAVLDAIGHMFADFSGTAIADQRSFLNNRLGRRVFGENIGIYDDVRHPLQAGPAFDGEGVPRRRLTLVEAGVPKELAYSRASARKAGVRATGHGFHLPNELGEAPANIVVRGGEVTLDEMIRSVRRGILVTRVWYIREVDPHEKIMTGMTRDGTFLIENGELAGGVRNFRFNQSLLRMLSNVQALGPAVRTSGEEAFDMVLPAMQVEDFHFTEVTRF